MRSLFCVSGLWCAGKTTTLINLYNRFTDRIFLLSIKNAPCPYEIKNTKKMVYSISEDELLLYYGFIIDKWKILFNSTCRNQKNKITIAEMSPYIMMHFRSMFSRVYFLDTSYSTCINRLAVRENISKELATNLINVQMSLVRNIDESSWDDIVKISNNFELEEVITYDVERQIKHQDEISNA